jgi:hypothetical protein
MFRSLIDRIVAAHLATGMISAAEPTAYTPSTAAKLYFDLIWAIQAERGNRQTQYSRRA